MADPQDSLSNAHPSWMEALQGTGALERRFESELAIDIVEELYPLLLENCTDEENEVDTQVVLESLAGLVGLFASDYREAYGDAKAKSALGELMALSINLYEERAEQASDEA